MGRDGNKLRAEQMLESGRKQLDPVLTPLGYRFDGMVTGRGSGEDFAIGRYARGAAYIGARGWQAEPTFETHAAVAAKAKTALFAEARQTLRHP